MAVTRTVDGVHLNDTGEGLENFKLVHFLDGLGVSITGLNNFDRHEWNVRIKERLFQKPDQPNFKYGEIKCFRFILKYYEEFISELELAALDLIEYEWIPGANNNPEMTCVWHPNPCRTVFAKWDVPSNSYDMYKEPNHFILVGLKRRNHPTDPIVPVQIKGFMRSEPNESGAKDLMNTPREILQRRLARVENWSRFLERAQCIAPPKPPPFELY